MNLEKLEKLVQNLEKYTIYLLIVLYPVFVLSAYNDTYNLPKEILLIALCSLVLVFWMIKAIVSGSFAFKVGKFDLGVLLVMIAYVVSTIVETPNKMEAFFSPGTTTLLLGSAVLYFLINQLGKKEKIGVVYSLVISSVLLAVSVLFTEIGFWAKIPQLPDFVKSSSFIAFGGNLPALIYLVSVFILCFGLILKEQDSVKKLFVGVSAAVILLGVIILGKNAIPGKSQAIQLTDFETSWSIAIETIKQSPFFGVGPGNYLTAFNLFRPVTYNQTPLWQIRFTTARDFYLTVLTETGFAGLLAFVILFMAIYKAFVSEVKNGISLERSDSLITSIALLALIIIFLMLPATPTIVTLLFILLALLSLSENKTVNMVTSNKAAGILISLPVVVCLVVLSYFGIKALSAERKFQLALTALSNNDAQGTYSNMQAAIAEESGVDRYHLSLAQVDMALATSIASKQTVSDSDKTTITQLVQEAINEGKAAVVLNPGRSGNWEVLAGIYKSIMPFATGADQFAIQTYSQAITLDPTNPNLRIELGGVYYALGQYPDAISSFQLATVAKSDLANAYYNLAVTYQAEKDYDNAIAAMQTVITLVPKGSQDYTLAQNTLSDLQKQKPAPATTPATNATGTTTGSQNLTAPQPEGKSNVKPPITLPQEATPPAATTAQ
jgi:O-antigen ligase/Tfp pilus assembly protein PilF